MKTRKSVSLLVLVAVFLFFANFVAQKKDSTSVAGYGELGGTVTTKNTAVTTTGGGVFEPLDRLYINENTPNRRFIPYTYLRQADVAWEKRVWRVIDLREKINQPLLYPKEPTQNRIAFMDILKREIKEGRIFAYSDDEFKAKLEFSQIMAKLVKESTAEETDSVGNVVGTKTIYDTITNEKITRITLKEDWFFEKQKSILDVRTLGIGFEYFDEDKGFYRPLFWIYYPQCRPVFAMYEVYNTKNDAERRTYEDFFWKRQFNSYIIKETNTYDRDIASYSKGLDALIEADRIKGDIFRWEHDLWHF